MPLAIQILVWDRHKYVVGLNRIMGFQWGIPDNWIANSNTDINKQ
jgi:hypothetical protein